MKDEHKNKALLIALLLIITSISIATLNLDFILKFLENWVWKYRPLHTALEIFGTVTAILLAIILYKREQRENSREFFPIVLGLLSMGLLNGFHAIAIQGCGFILLHNTASLIGGFCFALIWLPHSVTEQYASKKNSILWFTVAFSILFGVYTLMFRETLPKMIQNNGGFTTTAIMFSIFAGVFFITAGWRFFLDFYHSGSLESYLFIYLTIFLGLANLFFGDSAIWDFKWWSWHVFHLGAYLIICWFVIRGYLDTAFDLRVSIANHKQTANKLTESEEQKNIILNSIPDMIMQCDTNMRILWANKTALDMNPKSIGQPCYKAYASREEPCAGCPCKRAIETGQIEMGIKYQPSVKGIQGESYWEGIGVPLKDSRGKIISVIEIARNVTERKIMENELKVKENAIETSIDAIGFADLEGKVTYVNPSYLKMWGYSDDKELLGKLIKESWVDEDEITEVMEITQNTGCWVGEVRGKRKDCSTFDVQLSTSMVRDKNNKPICIMSSFVDITERKKMEEEFQKMQKLKSVGVLAGGIAHDFNNLLTAIIGNLSLIELYAKSGKNILEVLEETKRASQQTRRLTQQLLTFSTGGAPIKKGVSIAELLKDTASLALSGSNAICEFNLPDDLWWAEVDEGQIDQAINNMIINAKQAMAGGGTIRVWAENVIVGAEQGLPLKEGKYIKVSIKDQGTGIMGDDLPKIFDPYFTTKQAGNGLGLAITYSIINKHGGHITVESEMGDGTTFIILLPAFEKETFSVKDIEEEQVYKGKGSILFMDDQENIKNMVRSMLNQLGYEVEFVGDGTEAIEIYKKAKVSGQKFDAVILDLTIPGGMGGKETIRKLYEIDPEIKAIVSSGYFNDPIMSGYEAYGFKGAIAKPYEIQGLSKILYKVVNGEEEIVPT